MNKLRKPTMEDAAGVKALIAQAETGAVSQHLAAILKDIDPESYRRAMVLYEKFYTRPHVARDARGEDRVFVQPERCEEGAAPLPLQELDTLEGPVKRDIVCQIWNMLEENIEKQPK